MNQDYLASLKDSRKYAAWGKLPLRRTLQSGLFTTYIKEDAFYMAANERTLLFKLDKRSQPYYQLPYIFIEQALYQRKDSLETLKFVGGKYLELYLQNDLLPVQDRFGLRGWHMNVMSRSSRWCYRLTQERDFDLLIDQLMLAWCDEPIIYFDYSFEQQSLQIKAHIPLPKISAGKTKRRRTIFFNEYKELLCGKVVFYALDAFNKLPFAQQVEVNLLLLSSQPTSELILFDPSTAYEFMNQKEHVVRKLNKHKEKLISIHQKKDHAAALFDGSLPNQNVLLSARITRPEFLALHNSSNNSSPYHTLVHFKLKLEANEDRTTFRSVNPLF